MRIARQVFNWAVIGIGGYILLAHAPGLRDVEAWDKFIMLALLFMVVETRSILLEAEQVSFSAGFALVFTTMLVLGTPEAIWLVAFGSIVNGIAAKKPVGRVAFNIGMLSLATDITGTALSRLGVPVASFTLDKHWGPLVLAVLIYLLINTGLVALYLSLERPRSPLKVWKNTLFSSSMDYIGLGFLGLSMALSVIHEEVYGLLVATGLLLFLQKTFTHHVKIGREIAIRSYWERQAFTDSLTNLANHRQLCQWLEQSLPNNKPVSVIMIDIDDFKKYNDGLGHLMGDEILCQVADILMSNTRKKDLVIRYGGDEFVIVLNGLNKKGAIQVAERIRASVSSLSTAAFPISLSIGIASYPDDGLKSEELLRNADRALYDAKESGKNLVHSYSPS